MTAVLSALLYFLIPLAALVFFVVSLILYCMARAQNKRFPGSVRPDTLKTRLTLLIVSSVILGVLVLVTVGLIALLFMALAYM